jgi:hypothetical protein
MKPAVAQSGLTLRLALGFLMLKNGVVVSYTPDVIIIMQENRRPYNCCYARV